MYRSMYLKQIGRSFFTAIDTEVLNTVENLLVDISNHTMDTIGNYICNDLQGKEG